MQSQTMSACLVFFKGLSILGSTMGSKGEVLEIVRHVAAGS